MLSTLIIVRSRSKVGDAASGNAGSPAPRSHTTFCLKPLIFIIQDDPLYAPKVDPANPQHPNVFRQPSDNNGRCRRFKSEMAPEELSLRKDRTREERYISDACF